MKVARGERRNTKITATTSTTDRINVICTSRDRGADRLGAVGDDGELDGGRDGALQARQRVLHELHGLHDVGAGLALDVEHRRGLVLVPGGDAVVLHPADHAADVGEPHRRAVAPGDDQVAIGRRVDELVVGAEREGEPRSVEPTLGAVDVGVGDRGAHVLHRQPVGGKPRRIDAHAHGRPQPALHGDAADAVDLGKFRLQQRVGGVADHVDRH